MLRLPMRPIQLIGSLAIIFVLLALQAREPLLAQSSDPLTSAQQRSDAAQGTAPAQLEPLSYVLGQVTKVVANQQVAAALTSDGLALLDIRNPAQPRLVGYLVLQNLYPASVFDYADLALVDHYVYISCIHCGATKLLVVNIAVPTAPVIVGSMQGAADISVIHAQGDFLYVEFSKQFGIIDIRTPTLPVLMSTHALSGQFPYINDIEVAATTAGRYAFVIAQNGVLTIFDVTSAAAPQAIATYAPARTCVTAVALRQQANQLHLFITDCYVGLRVLDVTMPAQPKEIQVHSFGEDNGAYAIKAVADHLFVITDAALTANGDSNLHVLDATDPAALREVAQSLDVSSYYYTMAVADHFLVLPEEKSGIQLLDIADPAALAEVGRVMTTAAYRDLDRAGNYLYLTDPSGLKVIDPANPFAPALVAEIGITDTTQLAMSAGHALVTDWAGGLWLFDITQPTQPTLVSHSSSVLDSVTTDLVISGTLGSAATAFVGGLGCTPYDCLPSLAAIDLTDLQHPSSTVVITDGRGVVDMVQVDNYLFAATGNAESTSNSELLIFDVANPQQPVQVAQLPLAATATSMAVADDTLYIALSDLFQLDPLLTYDITTPTAPQLKHTLTTARPFGSISVDNGFLYGKNAFVLTVFSLADPFVPVIVDQQLLPGNGNIVAPNALLADQGTIYVLNDGLTIWRHQSDLLGHIFDAWGEPQGGVQIDGVAAVGAAGEGTVAVSGLHGGYAFPEPVSGPLTLQPTLAGAHFWPTVRTGVIPNSQEKQDFYLLTQPVSMTTMAGITSSLSYIDGRGLTTTIVIPADAVMPNTLITVEPIMAFDQDELHFTGNAFALQIDEPAEPLNPGFAQPVVVTIHYSDQGANAVLAEKNFQLLTEIEGRWQPVITAAQLNVPRRNLADNRITVEIQTSGRYALFSKADILYFPLIQQ